MSHLNFNMRAAQMQAPPRVFDPRANLSFNPLSVLWTVFAVGAVAAATFAIIWFA